MVGAVKDPIAGATVSLGVSTGKTNRDWDEDFLMCWD
jgi:hypothetical protein